MDLPGILGRLKRGRLDAESAAAAGTRPNTAIFLALILLLPLFACTLGGCSADQIPGLGSLFASPTAEHSRLVVVPYVAANSGALYPVGEGEAAPPTATVPPLPSVTPTPSMTPTAVPSSTPTMTPTPSPSATPTNTPTVTPTPINVGGIPVDEIVVMPPGVREKVRETAVLGRELGRDPRAFSKIGDSVALTPHYLTRFDKGPYVLGDYAYLQPAIDNYAGSFERYGVATRIGLHAWSLFDPLWANKEWCQPNENMVACEVRLHNPSVLLVRLGSNDAGAATAFDQNMRALVEYALQNGIVPILGTKADRFEGADDRNNTIIRQIAADYNLPIWDFDHVADVIPQRGLGSDQVHMTMADSNDYTDPYSFERGYPVSDLTALMAIYAVYQESLNAGDT